MTRTPGSRHGRAAAALIIQSERNHVPFERSSSWDSFVFAPAAPGAYVVWLGVDMSSDWPRKEPRRTELRGKLYVDTLVTRTERPATDEEIAWLFGRQKNRPKDMPDDKFFLAGTYEVPFTVKRDAWIFHHSEVVPLRGSVKQPKMQFAMYMGYTNTEVTSSVNAGGATVGLQMRSQTWDGEVRGTDSKGQPVPLIYTEANQWTINLPKEIPDYRFETVTADGSKQKEFNRNSSDLRGRTQEQLDNVIFPHLYRMDWMPGAESQTETDRSARVWYAWHTEDESDRASNAGRLDYFIGEYGPDTKEFWFDDYRKQYERIGLEIAIDTKDPGVIEKALEIARLEANSTDTRLLEAELLKMKGDTIAALMALRSAVASDPDHAVAKKMLQDAECAFLIEAIDKSQGAIQQSRAAFYGYLLERGFTNAGVQVKGDWAFARGMSWAKSTARVYSEEAWAVFTTGLFGSFSAFSGKLEGEELLKETTEKQMVTAFVGLNTILRLRANGYTFDTITNMTSLQVRDALPLRDYRGNLYPETNAANHCVAIREAMKLPDVQALIGVVPPEWVTKDRPAYTGDELALRLGVEKGYWNPKDVGDTWIEYIGDATSMYNLLLLLDGAKVGMSGRTTSIFWSQADIAMMQQLERMGKVISGTEAVANSIGLTHLLSLMGQTDSGKALVKALKKLDKAQAGLAWYDSAIWTAGKVTGMLTINAMVVIGIEHLVGHKAAMLMQAALMFGSDFELLGKLLDSRKIPRAKVIELIINDYLPATQLHYKRLAQLNKNNLEIEQILARVKAGQKLSANDLAFLDTKIGHENWRRIIPDGKASTNARFAQGTAAEGIQNGVDNGAAAAVKHLEKTLVDEQAATAAAEQDATTLVEGLKKTAPERGPPPPSRPPPRERPGTALITQRGPKEAMDPRATKGFPLPPCQRKVHSARKPRRSCTSANTNKRKRRTKKFWRRSAPAPVA